MVMGVKALKQSHRFGVPGRGSPECSIQPGGLFKVETSGRTIREVGRGQLGPVAGRLKVVQRSQINLFTEPMVFAIEMHVNDLCDC
jgi:hypothetical protein